MRASFRISILVSVLMLAFLSVAANAGEIKKTFTGVKEIRIKTTSGDCFVEKGSKDQVEVVVTYTYADEDYEPELEQHGSRLNLSEHFSYHSRSGNSTWRLTVPEDVEIDFSTASGDFEASDLKSRVEAKTASGDVQLASIGGEVRASTASGDVKVEGSKGPLKVGTASGNVELSKSTGDLEISTASGRVRASDLEGKLELSTASGDITLRDASGEFDLSAASGEIDATGVVLTGASEFSAASGDVEVTLAKSPEFDIELSAASGDAVLNFGGNPIRGYIEMTAKVRRGRIQAPFEFDNEEYHTRGNEEYVTRTVKKGSDTPRITISTASGEAVLRER